MRVTLISGSSREKALSHRVALLLKSELESKFPNDDFQILDIRDYPLPFVDQVFSNESLIPESHEGLKHLVLGADAFVLISPEYNGSYSAVMKNLLDHFPKFNRKAFGIVTYSTGALGGMRAAHQMQQMICAFFGVPCPHMLLIGSVDKKIDENGQKTDESLNRSLDNFTNEFMWLANALKQ
jgi:NAD(P)H-dependent FMN reductase